MDNVTGRLCTLETAYYYFSRWKKAGIFEIIHEE